MPKKICSIIICLSIYFTSVIPAFAQFQIGQMIPSESFIETDNDIFYAPDDEVTLIIEADGEPAAVCNSINFSNENYFYTDYARQQEQSLLKTQSQIIESIEQKTSENIEKGFTYTSLFNGFSINAKYKDIENIKKLPGVLNVYISETHMPIQPHISYAAEQTNVKSFVQNSNLTGEGQVIAIIDSEFDTNHEFFNFLPKNPRYSKSDITEIIENNSLNVSVTANQTYKNEKIPFAYDYGCNDADTFGESNIKIHGTHVAGIIGGKDGTYTNGSKISGIAPDSQMILMKISNKNGTLTDASLMAALDDASKFGVSVINLSLGTDYRSCSTNAAFLKAIENARNAGIFISSSSGNSSRGFKNISPLCENIDYSSSGIPASYSSATAVASADNIFSPDYIGKLILCDDSFILYKNAYEKSEFSNLFSGASQKIVYCGLGTTDDFKNVDLSGKIALVKRGNIEFAAKANNAKNANAKGIIIWNTDEEYILTPTLSLPAAFITLSSGQALTDSASSEVEVCPVSNVMTESATGNQISSYSSWGTTDELELKPEITAPGGNIYSSVPNDKYAYMSGTSMSAPHISGIIALLNQFYSENPYIEAFNNLSGNDKVTLFENLLMSTANVIKQDGIPSSPRVQGAGMANITNAAKTPVVLIGTEGKSKISLKDKLTDSISFSFIAKNLTNQDITYTSLSADILTDSYIQKDGKYYPDKMKKLTAEILLPENILVPAGGEADIPVTLKLDQNELLKNSDIFKNGFFIDGFIYLKTDDENACNLNIPFTGFCGDWKKVPIFDSTMYDAIKSSLYIKGQSDAPGTYLMSRFSNKSVMTGKNLYNGKIDKNYISFSPNGDDCYDDFIACLQPLRTSRVEIIISDSAGKTIAKLNSNNNINKFYDTYLTIPKSIISGLEDGSYTINIKGYYNYNKESSKIPNDEFSLPFVIDTQNPEITKAAIDTKNHRLTVNVSDNHYIQAAAIYYNTKSGMPKISVVPVANKKYSSNSDNAAIQFDITDADISSIQIEVCDYAMNTAASDALSLIYDLSYQLTDVYQDSNLTILTYQINNKSDNSITLSPIIAFYDNGRLMKITQETETEFVPGSKEYKFYINGDMSNSENVKIFLWESLNNMLPLSK